MKLFRIFAVSTLLALPCAALAVEPSEILSNPILESRARALSAELRCLVCQNQSIDDSQAPLAKDLRIIVRERLTAGDSDDAIRSYLVQRYGDFILLKPPFKVETLLLWMTPLAALLLGGFAVLRSSRASPGASSSGLTADEEQRLKMLLDEQA